MVIEVCISTHSQLTGSREATGKANRDLLARGHFGMWTPGAWVKINNPLSCQEEICIFGLQFYRERYKLKFFKFGWVNRQIDR